jgi:hypothetical protein
MELKFTVHLDDYHSNITAHWKTIEACVAHVNEERDGGYDVDRITVDGKPLFCTFRLQVGERRGQACGHTADFHPGSPSGRCITHAHFDEYQRHSAAGRYQGD